MEPLARLGARNVTEMNHSTLHPHRSGGHGRKMVGGMRMETEKQLLGALLDMMAEQQQTAAAVLSKLERQAQALDAVIQRGAPRGG